MKLQAILLLPLAFVAASPTAEPEEAASLDTRADKWCRVLESTPCNEGAGTAYHTHRTIKAGERFGVNCKAYGSPGTWDLIPGWGCWVSARFTRADKPGTGACEDGVPWC